jgi:hypothetical protein
LRYGDITRSVSPSLPLFLLSHCTLLSSLASTKLSDTAATTILLTSYFLYGFSGDVTPNIAFVRRLLGLLAAGADTRQLRQTWSHYHAIVVMSFAAVASFRFLPTPTHRQT